MLNFCMASGLVNKSALILGPDIHHSNLPRVIHVSHRIMSHINMFDSTAKCMTITNGFIQSCACLKNMTFFTASDKSLYPAFEVPHPVTACIFES